MTTTSSDSALVGRPALGGWNYRVFVRQVPTGEGDTEPEHFIGEAYYDKDSGDVVAWSGPIEVVGQEDVKSVRAELLLMLDALDKPVLDYDAEPPSRDYRR